MGDVPTYHDDAVPDCTTTGSFTDHGIEDGSALVQRTYYRLVDGECGTFEPTDQCFDQLESAFIRAYLATVETADVPAHVAAAIDDARVLTAEEFRDEADADLRTAVNPRFYQLVAGFHCVYRE